MKNKYHKESGLILNYCEIKIDKPTKTVKYIHHQYKVIISNATKYVVENHYGSLELVDRVYSKHYSSDRAVNKVKTYEQKWHSKYLEDYISSYCISTFSEKVTKIRVKNALYKFIQKEAYFYNGLEHEIEEQLKFTKTPTI